jgi:hypothetical protein
VSEKKPRYVEFQRSGAGGRWYWRPKDRPGVPLGADRVTAWSHAAELNRERDAERAGLGKVRLVDGTVRWLTQRYLASPYFREKAPKTRHEYQRAGVWLVELWGDLPAEAITPRVVQEAKAAGTATPWETNARLRFVSLLYGWARLQGLVAANPAERFRKLRTRPRAVIWEPEEVTTFLRDATPSIRLAVALGLYTLQREGDLLLLPWSAVAGGRFRLTQQKTGKLVGAELHPVLHRALEATRRQAVQVLVSEATAKPYRADHFRHVFAYDRARLGLRRELQFRDLRRTGAVTLARDGVPLQQIAALAGWEIGTTQEILKTYVPLDEGMATAAIRAWASEKLR